MTASIEADENAGASPFAGIDHVGYVVPDLAAATRFMVEALGFAALPRTGSASDPAGDRMTGMFGVHPRAESRFAFFATDGGIVELLEWTAPDRRMEAPRNSDAGGRHLALRVRDLDAAVARLSAYPGVTIRERSERGFVYVATPIGLEIQLMPV